MDQSRSITSARLRYVLGLAYRAIPAAAGVALIASLLFACVNYAALGISASEIRSRLRLDFETNPGAFRNGGATFNDCMTLAMTVDRPDGRLAAAISPNRLYSARQDMCGGLRDLAADGRINPETHISVPYHHYWSGVRTILTATVPMAGVAGTRRIFRAAWAVSFIAALAAGVYCLRQLRRASEHTRRFGMNVVVVLSCILVFFQASENSVAFHSAPTDSLFFILILLYAASVARGSVANPSAGLLGLFGALVAYFELLHGAIPLFVGAVLFLEATRGLPSESFGQTADRTATAVGAFVTGFVVAFLVHLVLVWTFVDRDVFVHVADALLHRITGDAREFVHPAIANRFQDKPVSLIDLARSNWRYAGTFTHGFRWLGVSAILFTALLQGIGLLTVVWRWRWDRGSRLIVACLLGSTAIYTWWAVFLEHSIGHPFFMMRLWAWPIAMSVIIASWATENVRRWAVLRTGARHPEEGREESYRRS